MARFEVFSILWVIWCHLLSAYLFSSGFLLTRYELPNHAVCINVGDSNGRLDSACPAPVYDRVVLIIVDALRFDFALFDENLAQDMALNFQNRLPSLWSRLVNQPHQTRLFRFMADPPTVTMQRLKAIVTGGLPTFMEFRRNFDSDRIHEDNLIWHLNKQKKNITFMGDDTWMQLFPESFTHHFPFPSFNVKDLNTVDFGCISNLIPSLRLNDSAFTIAHFLGVDHVGHTFSSNHPMMRTKLAQIDTMLDNVLREIRSRSTERILLLVMGDHGMTAEGDHGGATSEETSSALFAYSTRPLSNGDWLRATDQESDHESDIVDSTGLKSLILDSSGIIPVPSSNLLAADRVNPYAPWLFSKARRRLDTNISPNMARVLPFDFAALLNQRHLQHSTASAAFRLEQYPTLAQVDLVPTLALLMGLPIPFGNIGAIIPDFFNMNDASPTGADVDSLLVLLEALYTNAHQVALYISTYATGTGVFSSDSLAQLQSRLTRADLLRNTLPTLNQWSLINTSTNINANILISSIRRVIRHYRSYLRKAGDEARDQWITFDHVAMAAGILLWCASSLALSAQLWRYAASVEVGGHAATVLDTGVIIGVFVPTACVLSHLWHCFSVGLLVSLAVNFVNAAVSSKVDLHTSLTNFRFLFEICFVATLCSCWLMLRHAFVELSNSHITERNHCRKLPSLGLSIGDEVEQPIHVLSFPSDLPHTDVHSSLTTSLVGFARFLYKYFASTHSFENALCFLAFAAHCGSHFSNSFINAESSIVHCLLTTSVILRWWLRQSNVAEGVNCTKISDDHGGNSNDISDVIMDSRVIFESQSLLVVAVLLRCLGNGSVVSTVEANKQMLFTMTELLPQLLCVVYLMWLSVIGWRCLITISGSPRAFVGVCTMSPHILSALRIGYVMQLYGYAVSTGYHLAHMHNSVVVTSQHDALSDIVRLWMPWSVYVIVTLGTVLVVVVSLTGDRRDGRSSNLMHLTHFVLLQMGPLVLLLIGLRFALSLSAAVLIVVCLIRASKTQCTLPAFADLIFLWLLAVRLFFASGHTNQFASVKIAAAFIGFDEFQLIPAFALVTMNTCVGELVVVASVVWIVINISSGVAATELRDHGLPSTGGEVNTSQETVNVYHGITDGQIAPKRQVRLDTLCYSVVLLRSLVWSLLCMSLLHGLRLLVSSINALVQRRHLMVWSIFAPKFMFDLAKLLVFDALLVVVVAATMLVTQRDNCNHVFHSAPQQTTSLSSTTDSKYGRKLA